MMMMMMMMMMSPTPTRSHDTGGGTPRLVIVRRGIGIRQPRELHIGDMTCFQARRTGDVQGSVGECKPINPQALGQPKVSCGLIGGRTPIFALEESGDLKQFMATHS
jgi:hypothetical protein